MAGAAAKRTAKNAAVKSRYYSALALGGSVINFIIQIGFFDRSLSAIMISCFLALVAWLSLKMITSALELGVGYDLWQDLFVINFVVQIGGLWSKYVWLLYLAVPGYAVYMLGGKVLNYVFTPKEAEMAEAGKEKKRKNLARY